ncbi:hypothetical protein OG339_24740 [Streptosporangium sp. NBC_01495]|uniref:hypothetical protein n=1 Tax=Streptosporangium sp. NBC_01495 TaxID=2903899 RepID=UPI002E3106D4|nr:hypothetical protein [Streptosporangium sp. NBC_01495]
MKTLEALATAPEGVLFIGIVCVLVGWLRFRTNAYREDSRTRRLELSIRETKSEHREAVIRACLETPNNRLVQ